MAQNACPVPSLRARPTCTRSHGSDHAASRPVVVLRSAPEPPALAQTGMTVAVWAAAVALVAVALIAVVALLLGAVELGVALHDATHLAPVAVGQTY